MNKHLLAFALFAAIGLSGCTRIAVQNDPPGQWVLESYSADKGYEFRKDGVQYKAHCRMSYTPGRAEADPSGDQEPIPPGTGLVDVPSPSAAESTCSAILPYLHKAVPLTGGGDILIFTQQDGPLKNWTYEFTITEAK